MTLTTYKCLLCGTTTIYPHACPEFFSKDIKQISVEQFKMACVSDRELSDKHVEILMKFVVLNSEDDVLEFCAILEKYRPNLAEKFAKKRLSNGSIFYSNILQNVRMLKGSLMATPACIQWWVSVGEFIRFCMIWRKLLRNRPLGLPVQILSLDQNCLYCNPIT